MEESLNDMRKVVQLNPSDQMAQIDLKMLEILKQGSMNDILNHPAYRSSITKINDLLNSEKELSINFPVKLEKSIKKPQLKELVRIPTAYKENIFSREDLMLYRGIFNWYSQNYSQAITV